MPVLYPSTIMSDQVPVASARKFNPSYFSTCGGFIRIIILILGIMAIVLASIGSPNDLNSYDGSGGFYDYYGYGLGYIVEPLNIIFIVFLILAWLFALGFLVFSSVLSRGNGHTKTMNRVLHFLFGLLLLIGVVCGAVGSYYFWEGCCHVYPPARGELFFRYHFESFQGYRDWCRCALRINSGSGTQKYRETYEWRQENQSLEIVSAWPHHFTAHILSLVLAIIDVIFYFVAACVA